MSMLMRRLDIDGDGRIGLVDLQEFVLRDSAPTLIELYAPKKKGVTVGDLATNGLQARKVIQTLRRNSVGARPSGAAPSLSPASPGMLKAKSARAMLQRNASNVHPY